MIEFNGPLTGDAHKHYLYKFSRSVSRVVRAALVFPLIFFGALIHTNNFILMMLTGVLFVILYSSFVLLFFRKFSKKANIDKIIITNEFVESYSREFNIRNKISKVEEVYDYGDFYEIIYPSGYIVSIYICQKNLISKGSLKEFESLWKDKISRKELIKTKKSIAKSFFDIILLR